MCGESFFSERCTLWLRKAFLKDNMNIVLTSQRAFSPLPPRKEEKDIGETKCVFQSLEVGWMTQTKDLELVAMHRKVQKSFRPKQADGCNEFTTRTDSSL